MAAATVAPPVEEALAWEAEQRPRAGIAGILAGVLIFASFVISIVAFSDQPNVLLTDGLRDALGQPLADGRKGLLTAKAAWYDDNAVPFLATVAVSAIGTIFIAFILGYLFRAVQARRPETSRFLLFAALVGPIFFGIGPLVSAGTAVLASSAYISDGDFSTLGAHDALGSGQGLVVGQLMVFIGQTATALAVVLLALNAMRVGLLTRFVGVLGCIVGALILLAPVLGPAVFVQSFWLIALGLLILGRVRAVPPAWASGRAEPWPSQQELRERKEREARGGDSGSAGGSVAVRADEVGAGSSVTPHPASKKRKRKRR